MIEKYSQPELSQAERLYSHFSRFKMFCQDFLDNDRKPIYRMWRDADGDLHKFVVDENLIGAEFTIAMGAKHELERMGKQELADEIMDKVEAETQAHKRRDWNTFRRRKRAQRT